VRDWGRGVIRLFLAGFLAAVAIGPSPARADLVIRGEAVEALKCATVILASMVILQRENLLTPAEVALGRAVANLILEQVPGTERQKQQAVQIMAKRLLENKTPDQILRTFKDTLAKCEKRFS
jgi:hypothetical protein